MDRTNRLRATVRSSITRTVNEITAELAKEESNHQVLRIKLEKLNELLPEVMSLDKEVIDALLDANCSDQQFEEENLKIEEYGDKIRTAKMKINDVIQARIRSPSPSEYFTASGRTIADIKKTHKLPKIEIKKFNGEMKHWLGFWSQFSKIHEDEDLVDINKFHYLANSMVPGSRAEKVLESYPQSSENYKKVVAALQDRFGDEVLLSEYYVRELIKLMITNTGESKDLISLTTLYDELESHIRSLESVGVKVEQSAIFLYPMVESSLPVETIKVWQRSPASGYGETGSGTPVVDRLQEIMKFLRQEVKGE